MHRLLDFWLDERFVWNWWRTETTYVLNKTNFGTKPLVCLTFDVEEDYPSKQNKTAEQFLEKIVPLFSKYRIPGTFFIQGEIAALLQKNLKILVKKGHELGLHGWHHDNWGNRVWFWGKKPLSSEMKMQNLIHAMQIFKNLTLPKPNSFRAPNLNSNQETEELLKKYNFRVDSSFPSFRKRAVSLINPKYSSIPVSNFPQPEIHWSNSFPFKSWKVFNLENLISMSNAEIDTILQANQPTVFLAHPWEYFPNSRFKHCGNSNWNVLENLIKKLKSKNSEFITMSDVSQKLK